MIIQESTVEEIGVGTSVVAKIGFVHQPVPFRLLEKTKRICRSVAAAVVIHKPPNSLKLFEVRRSPPIVDSKGTKNVVY